VDNVIHAQFLQEAHCRKKLQVIIENNINQFLLFSGNEIANPDITV
jgi:hypothetical protein